jgi:hypothetical protein
MTLEVWYWVILGVICIVPFVLGLYVMKRTQKISVSMVLSSAAGAIITSLASIWWVNGNDEPFTIRLGIGFYVISYVNIMVLVLFALLSIRKNPEQSEGQSQ